MHSKEGLAPGLESIIRVTHTPSSSGQWTIRHEAGLAPLLPPRPSTRPPQDCSRLQQQGDRAEAEAGRARELGADKGEVSDLPGLEGRRYRHPATASPIYHDSEFAVSEYADSHRRLRVWSGDQMGAGGGRKWGGTAEQAVDGPLQVRGDRKG